MAEETSNLKVQIELLKKEIAESTEKSKSKEKEKDKEREKERAKGEEGDKVVKNLQEKNLELLAEVTRVRGESTLAAEDNVKLKRDNAQLWAGNSPQSPFPPSSSSFSPISFQKTKN